MTVGELIRFLNNYPKRTKVLIWDPDAGEWATPTGATIYQKELKLYCDED